MKKLYMTPDVQLSEMELQQLMALSLVDERNADAGADVLSRGENPNFRRRNNVWDDEELDEN
jgi:hypothetical protein